MKFISPHSFYPRRKPIQIGQALCAIAFCFASSLQAQLIYGTSGSTYMQNFNSMTIATGTATLPTGWRTGTNVDGPGSTTVPVNYYNTNTGAMTSTANSYAFGTTDGVTPSTNLALGGITASGARVYQLQITNNTGITLSQFSLSYTGEQWRQVAASETLTFYYGVGTQTQANMTAAGSAFNFTALHTGSATNLDGTLSANQTAGLGGTVTGLNWSNGTSLYIRWSDSITTNAAFAIDDVTFSAIPEPSTWTLLGIGLAAGLHLARRKRFSRG